METCKVCAELTELFCACESIPLFLCQLHLDQHLKQAKSHTLANATLNSKCDLPKQLEKTIPRLPTEATSTFSLKQSEDTKLETKIPVKRTPASLLRDKKPRIKTIPNASSEDEKSAQLYTLVRAYYKSRHFDEAIAVYAAQRFQILKHRMQLANVAYTMGKAFQGNKLWERAVCEYAKAVKAISPAIYC